MSLIVYRYGLLAPIESEKLVREQLRKAHAYRNVLTEIERGRRAAMRLAERAQGEIAVLELAAKTAEEAEERAAAEVSRARAATRSRSETDEQKAALKAARKAKTTARKALAEARRVEREKMHNVDVMIDLVRRGTSHLDGDVVNYLAAKIAYEDLPATTGPRSNTRMAARDALAAAAFAIHDTYPTGASLDAVRADARRHAINARAGALRRAARESCGLPPGTYLLIEAEADAAAKMPLYDGVEPSDPHFVRFTGEGSLSVQIQGGLSVADLHNSSQDPRLHVAPLPDSAWVRPNDVLEPEVAALRLSTPPVGWGSALDPEERQRRWLRVPEAERLRDPRPRVEGTVQTHGGKRSRTQTQLRMRVGAHCATWPMVMHRPLPEGAVVRQAVVHVRRIGPREEWYVTFTVALDETRAVRRCGEGVVAVDLGWRQIGDEIRVAAWVGSDGDRGEIRLTARDIGGLRKADELRSIRDDSFNLARARLVGWLTGRTVPVWLHEATSSLAQWKSPARLVSLVHRWEKNRFPGDEEVFGRRATPAERADHMVGPGLAGWEQQDHHLWTWETSQRTGALRHRQNVYRCAAAKLALKYETIVLEDFDLSEIARRPGMTDPHDNATARGNRQLAAPGELRLTLINAFQSRLGKVGKVPAAHTTTTCHVCGQVEAFDAASDVMHVCTGCHTTWDQDDNAAIVMLAVWDAQEKKATAAAATGPRESKWAKRKREKSDRSTPSTAAAE